MTQGSSRTDQKPEPKPQPARYAPLQIGICGTFDLENYGDLLFPIVAEHELQRRLGAVELRRFSYAAKAPPDWPYLVSPLSELPTAIGSLDGLMIGGGDLIRFDKEVAPGYLPAAPDIHHPTGYWLVPALLALNVGCPLVWNAPGVYKDLPGWAEPILRFAIASSDYVAVRDQLSRAALEHVSDTSKISVVPDTGLGVAGLIAE